MLGVLCRLGLERAARDRAAATGRCGCRAGRSTLLQIGIGILDLGCCALAMYMLLPDEPNIGFVTLAVIFVSATLLGFASHAPGGLGVFDAAMLVALWQFDKEELLAGLLLFRLLYYVVPFVLALMILGCARADLCARGRGAIDSGARRGRRCAAKSRARRRNSRLTMASSDDNCPARTGFAARLRDAWAALLGHAG